MLLDTDVMVDILRLHPPALSWFAGLGTAPVGLPGFVAMELIQGCNNLIEQRRLERHLRRFSTYWPSEADCRRALLDFAAYRLSHNLGMLDALIGQTAVGMGETLATFNVKHFSVVSGVIIIQPY